MKNYIKLLDALLEDLVYSSTIQFVSRESSNRKSKISELTDKFSAKEVAAAYEKLTKDGYIYRADNREFISINGFVFVQNGGYKQQKLSNQTKERFTDRVSRFVLWGSIAAIIYTTIELIRFFIKDIPVIPMLLHFMECDHHSCCCH